MEATPGRRARAISPLVGILLVQAALLLVGVMRNFVVLDEVGHVPAGLSHWELGDFSLYRVNPPLPDMVATLPLLFARARTNYEHLSPSLEVRSDWEVGRDFAGENGHRYLGLIRLARLPGVLGSLLGTWLVFRWGRELYGEACGYLGAAVWAFDPTALTFSAIVTTDVAAAVAGLAASFAFWHYLRRGTRENALLAGFLLGIALLTKFTLLLLCGVWPVVALIWSLGRPRPADPPRRWRAFRSGLSQWGLIILASLYTLNLGYKFDGSFRRLGDFTFQSATLAGRTAEGGAGPWSNRFEGTWLGGLRVPLPAEFVQGIDAQKKDFESRFPSYLAGHWKEGGWYHYYLYGILVKEPLGLLALAAWGLALVVWRHPASSRRRDEYCLLLPAGSIFVFVSLQDGFNHHMRYILPALPFVAVATAKLGYFLRRGPRVGGVAVVALLGWSLSSTLAIHPHSMSYFNELAGGPIGGHAHLVDSNIDWGQDLLHLKDWLDSHPEARPLGLAFCHFIDPGPFLGIDYRLPPLGPDPSSRGGRTEPCGPLPGYYALSVNFLRGITFKAPDGQGEWRWIARHDAFAYFLRHFRPIARAGYSIYIYHITPEQADRARLAMGLPPLGQSPDRGGSMRPP